MHLGTPMYMDMLKCASCHETIIMMARSGYCMEKILIYFSHLDSLGLKQSVCFLSPHSSSLGKRVPLLVFVYFCKIPSLCANHSSTMLFQLTLLILKLIDIDTNYWTAPFSFLFQRYHGDCNKLMQSIVHINKKKGSSNFTSSN